MVKRLVLVILAMMTMPAVARTVVVPEAHYVVDEVVSGETVKTGKRILDDAASTVHLVIDSPGGSVYSGMDFVSSMERAKERGATIKCYVLSLAASMAFQILAHCDERYALRGSYLLWHPVRVSGYSILTPRKATTLAMGLVRIQKWLVGDLRRRFNIPTRLFYRHYRAETLHVASQLNELVPGWLTLVDDIKVAGRAESGSGLAVGSSGQLQYIHQKALRIWQQKRARIRGMRD